MSGSQNRAISPTSFYGPKPSGSRGQPRSPQPCDTPAKHKGVATLNPHITTPVTHKQNASAIYTSSHFKQDENMIQMGWEMEGRFVGPMPVEEFIKTFLPRATAGNRPLTWDPAAIAAFEKATDQTCEIDMYIPLIEALQPFCPDLELVDTHAHPDLTAQMLKPDIGIYAKDCDRDKNVITNFSKFEFQMELKFDGTDDAFQKWHPGDNHMLERDSVQGNRTKGQITSYAATHLAKQFRTFVFSVLICGHGTNCEARLLRWDRSGAVVTEPFPVRGRRLADFFWRYNHLSPEDRGVDMSVSRPSEEEASAALQALKLPSTERSTLKLISVVNTDGDHTSGRFIVGDPAFQSALSATGRSSRGFVAYYLEKKTLVFLKDTWRTVIEGIRSEGTIYQILHKHRIPHIPPCILSGDVAQDKTKSQSLLSQSWVCNVERRRLMPLNHYRLVLGTIACVLNDFTSTRELVVAVGDAFEAHKMAWEKAKILHRDISVGNILITQKGHGLLIDWDLCKHEDDLNAVARRDERTGTWQFMSAKLLTAEESDSIPHTLQDDMESFVHVLGWLALRYMSHGLPASQLAHKLVDIFDYVTIGTDGRARGGLAKQNALISGEIPNAIRNISCGRFHKLLAELTSTIAVRYQIPPTDEELAEHRKHQKELSAMEDSDAGRALVIARTLMERSKAYDYVSKTERMKDSQWMYELFKKAVSEDSQSESESDLGPWPSDDGAIKNVISHSNHHPSGRKRKADEDHIGEHLPVQKLRSAGTGDESPVSESQAELQAELELEESYDSEGSILD